MVATANVGPAPIPYKTLNAGKLADAIRFCLSESTRSATWRIAQKICRSSGAEAAVRSFHRNLPVTQLSCDILPDHPAVWVYKKARKEIKLSGLAAEVLYQHLKVDRKSLKL